MWPAKRHFYTVQDVIVAVLNGVILKRIQKTLMPVKKRQMKTPVKWTKKPTTHWLLSQWWSSSPNKTNTSSPRHHFLKICTFSSEDEERMLQTLNEEWTNMLYSKCAFIFTFQKKRSVFGIITANEHGWTLGRRRNSVL